MPQQLNFLQTVNSLKQVDSSQTIQTDGNMNQITMHFPSGANALVDVAVFVNAEQIVPDVGYVALDGATPTFPVNRQVHVGDNVLVRFINHDSSFSHTISVIAGIVD